MSNFGYEEKRRKISSSSSSRSKWKRRRDWSGLPRNVLFDIMDKLSVIDDYVRFGGVCRSWRTIFLSEISLNINNHCSQPFLFIPSTHSKALLYSLSTRSLYKKFHFRLPPNNFFQGSSFGWLVCLETDNTTHSNYRLQLCNPFLSKDYIIHLPSPDDLQRQHLDATRAVGHWQPHYIRKAILSSDPSLSDDFIVMAITSRYRGLAFYKHGDTCWTSIGNWVEEFHNKQMVQDVIFFNKTKQFYAIRDNKEIVSIDIQVISKESHGPQLQQLLPPFNRRATRAYLVEDVSGELLVVLKLYVTHDYRFFVYKINLDEKKWTQIRNLGTSVLFLGFSGSIARSLSHCPGCQPNCIYFTDDVNSSMPIHQWCQPRYSGVYSLDDVITRPHYCEPTCSTQILPAPIWLEPTLFPSMTDVSY